MSVTGTYALPRTAGEGRYRRALKAVTSSAISLVTTAAAVIVAPHRAALARLADMPLTLAAAGLLDYAAFQLPAAWGYVATAVTLLVIERMISDDTGGAT